MPIDDHQQKDLELLINEFLQYRLSRREFLKRAGALGLATGPAASWLESLGRSGNYPTITTADLKTWFLRFSSEVYNVPNGAGRPWGDGTAIARLDTYPNGNGKPWDENCTVTPMIGGYEAMSSMRQDLEEAIKSASSQSAPAGKRGHVYIADWRFNPLRDLSATNDWGTNEWNKNNVANPDHPDQTAMGLVLRLMQAGVQVRILLWMPVFVSQFVGLGAHMSDHYYVANVVEAECKRLVKEENFPDGIGVVALDIRVASPLTATHHQKMMIIRVGDLNVAYCGGVDLAFTRRDALYASTKYTKQRPQFLGGDWQSGTKLQSVAFDDKSDKTHRWPKQDGVSYEALRYISRPAASPNDLTKVEVYGDSYQIWHDQHLRLEGGIVKTLEGQFCERWKDTVTGSRLFDLGSSSNWSDNQVIFSSATAFNCVATIESFDCSIVPLSAPVDVLATAPANPLGLLSYPAPVQMWRTIPLRNREGPPFTRGEFTVMAGIAQACKAAKQQIWIFDQYFFSQPLGRLLNFQVMHNPNLCVIVILPPYADSFILANHHARKLTLNELTKGLTRKNDVFGFTKQDGTFEGRIGVYNLRVWDSDPKKVKGIYCHTKVQMYDRTLLVCGSANLNRRSFTCDSEIACAVLSPQLVDGHQQRLWSVLFPNSLWPGDIDFSEQNANWGKDFFAEFQKAAALDGSFLAPDVWWNVKVDFQTIDVSAVRVTTHPPLLFGGSIAREQDYPEDYLDQARKIVSNPNLEADKVFLAGQQDSKSLPIELHLDPSSLSASYEHRVSEEGMIRDCRLDDIVARVEEPDAKGHWPRRKR